jgi:hypothetical protein
MVTVCTPVHPKSIQHGNVLHEVVNRLVTSFSGIATSNKNLFVNEIPGHLQLAADPQMIASVISGLLSSVVSYAKDSCIRLSAKIYGNVILVQVKDSSSFNINAIESQVKKLQPLAERIRGSVGVTSQRNNITTLTFGFPNLPL